MKKRMLALIIAVFGVCLLLAGCTPKLEPLTAAGIADVEITTHNTFVSRRLTDDEVAEFVRLYNAATYGEKILDNVTPGFGLSFTLRESGKEIYLNDAANTIACHGTGVERFLQSPELFDFIKNLAQGLGGES